MSSKEQVTALLTLADIQIGDTRPWDIQVHNEKFYDRVMADANLGAGEAYMDEWWDCQKLDQFFERLILAKIQDKINPAKFIPHIIKGKILNMQTKHLSKQVAQEHYDVGNTLYSKMLGKHMQYTCGYYEKTKKLDDAQLAKLDLVAKKLMLKPGMKILELGSGFGGLAYHLAKKYKCEVTSYNISKEQVAYGREWCKGLPVTFMETDYRDAIKLSAKSFDRVVSVGLLEHIGHKNYRSFLELAFTMMKDDGIFVLHSIGGNKSKWSTDPWIDKYIFPHGHLPSITQLGDAIDNLWVVEDWQNFGPDYDNTLMAWHANIEKSWKDLPQYDERFRRMWRYYLLSCAGGFRARGMQLWQLVLTKPGRPGSYRRPVLK